MSQVSAGDRSGDRVMDQLFVDALPTPVFVIQDQRFAYVNAAFAELMALDRNALLGADSLERLHPDDRAFVLQQRQMWGTQSASVSQLRVRRGDDAERNVLVTTTPILHGGRSAIVGTAMDITVQPDALTIAVRMAALGRLAGGVAHDFNNLLLVVGGHVERLQEEIPAGHPLRHAADAIAAAAERAAVLTDQLLSFGRRQMLIPQVTDLSALVGEMDSELRTRLGPAVNLTLDRAAGVRAIRADRPRLSQVLRHLVDNARDAMPDGGTVTIAVDMIAVSGDLQAKWPFLRAGGEFVRLRVADTGRGMEPEVMPHVFEPFFTTKGRGRGAGMGLASVYGIVKQSAGYVFIDQTGVEGTCISILLPPVDVVDETPKGLPAPSGGAAAAARPRVLVVEDDMSVRELLADLLPRYGFEVSTAETAEQAQLMAADQMFDLLLADVGLPGMNGAHLVRALRASLPHMAAVLMSGYPADSALDDAASDARRILLRKPFSTAQLVSRLHEALSTGCGAAAQTRP
jgi:two-component system, cell cycle sensor histidine kinase and response regulator CckA